MKNHPTYILLIGAGASLGAREGKQNRPPLGNELCAWLRNTSAKLLNEPALRDFHSTINSGLALLNANSQEMNFEKLIATLENREDRVVLHRLIQITFSDLSQINEELDFGFNFSPDGYDQLIDSLKINERYWSVISLNYDILFEQALQRKQIPYHYSKMPFESAQSTLRLPGVCIYKPHGSINFFTPTYSRTSYYQPPPNFMKPQGRLGEHDWSDVTPIYEGEFAGLPRNEKVLERALDQSIEPIMANYTSRKLADVNHNSLVQIRWEADVINWHQPRLVSIGVKPTSKYDDQFVYGMLTFSSHPRLTYVSPSNSDCSIVKEHNIHAQIERCGLMDYLKRLNLYRAWQSYYKEKARLPTGTSSHL